MSSYRILQRSFGFVIFNNISSCLRIIVSCSNDMSCLLSCPLSLSLVPSLFLSCLLSCNLSYRGLSLVPSSLVSCLINQVMFVSSCYMSCLMSLVLCLLSRRLVLSRVIVVSSCLVSLVMSPRIVFDIRVFGNGALVGHVRVRFRVWLVVCFYSVHG
jgi:hypothetical protein